VAHPSRHSTADAAKSRLTGAVVLEGATSPAQLLGFSQVRSPRPSPVPVQVKVVAARAAGATTHAAAVISVAANRSAAAPQFARHIVLWMVIRGSLHCNDRDTHSGAALGAAHVGSRVPSAKLYRDVTGMHPRATAA
jgi:hypothetical protein